MRTVLRARSTAAKSSFDAFSWAELREEFRSPARAATKNANIERREIRRIESPFANRKQSIYSGAGIGLLSRRAGHGAARRIFSATLPRSSRRRPVLP